MDFNIRVGPKISEYFAMEREKIKHIDVRHFKPRTLNTKEDVDRYIDFLKIAQEDFDNWDNEEWWDWVAWRVITMLSAFNRKGEIIYEKI